MIKTILDLDFKFIGAFGKHMRIREFVTSCRNAALMDCDGFAVYATQFFVSNVQVDPSEIVAGNINPEFAWVVWFNK